MDIEKTVQNSSGNEYATNLDQSLAVIQVGRRLQKITRNIECFLQSQIDRLEDQLSKCQIDLDRIDEFQRISVELELQKENWEKKKKSDVERLNHACGQLIEGWKQLETAKQELRAEQLQCGSVPFASNDVNFNDGVSSNTHSDETQIELDAAIIDSLREAIEDHRNRLH